MKRRFINLPKLILVLVIVSCSVLPGADDVYAATSTIYATADTYIDSDGWGYENELEIYVGCEPISWGLNYERAAVKFDLSSIGGTVTQATLRIYIKQVTNSPYVNLYGAYDDTWLETTTTLPNNDVTIFQNNDTDLIMNTWKEFDVTAFINSEISRDGGATFVLSGAEYQASDTVFTFAGDEDANYKAQLVYTSTNASIAASTALSEANLDTNSIDVTLSGTTFADGTLDAGSFTLNNVPAGLTVEGADYTDSTHCTVNLAYDGTDFDSDITNLGLTIAGAELASGSSLTADNTLTISATNESESIIIADDGNITEGAEDGEVITVTLSGGTLVSVITPANWTVANLPSGVSKGSVTRVNDTTVKIALSGNATMDYDTNITNVTVNCTTAEYNDSTAGVALSANTGVTLIAKTAATVTTGSASSITATSATVSGNVTSDGGAAITARGIEYKTGAGSYTPVSASAGTGSYSINLTGLAPATTYVIRAYATNAEGTSYGSEVSFATQAIAASIAASTALSEANLDINGIDVTLSGTTFADGTLNAGSFTLNNAPAGLTVEGADYTDSTHCTVNLAYDGTDFDSDITNLGLTIAGAELASGSSLTADNTLTISATNESESISVTGGGSIAEGSESGAAITVTLTGGTFSPVLNKTNWALSACPTGVAIGDVIRDSATQARVILTGTAADYDSDITASVNCTAAEYNDSAGAVADLSAGGISFAAKVTPTVTTGSASSITATSATVSGNVTSDGGAAVTARGIEYKTGAGSYTLVSASAGTGSYSINLTGLAPGTTYIIRAYATNAEGTSYGSEVSFATQAITASIAASTALSEANLDTNSIDVTLSGTTFADGTLDAGSFTLNNAPVGVTVESVDYTDSTHCTVNLAYDGTDFDSNISNLGLTVAGAELASGSSLTADNTLTISATNESESITITDDGSITEGAEDGEVITVTLTGGTFASVITPANWTVTNLPDGVSKGSVTRVNGTTVAINLSGNRTVDYDSNITNVTVSCTAAEYNDSSGGGALSANTGVTINSQSSACDVTVVTTLAGAEINGIAITASVGNATTSVTVDAAVSPDASWKLYSDDSCTSEIVNNTMNLAVGANTAYIMVTAQDGTTQKTYTLNINRASRSSSSSTSNDETVSTDAEVIVNGEVENIGTVNTVNDGEQTITTVVLDEQMLQDKLENEADNIVITIPVNKEADVVVGELNGQMVLNMEDKKATVEVKTDIAAYTLPVQQIKINSVSEQLGESIELKDIKVQIEISKSTGENVRVIENSAKQGEFTIVTPPVEFAVKCVYKNKTVEVANFTTYVERTIAIPEGVEPNKITTGVVIDPDGTVRHVPTKIVVIDGKYYAKINSLTNSSYSVIWHPMEFQDIESHWAKEAVNDMGSRMVISGVGNNSFEPDRYITRAEFAAIVVRALGLPPGTGKNPFADVESTQWYCEFIETAHEYGIISGYGSGRFGPMDKITREQAMTMIDRASKITSLKYEDNTQGLDSFLAEYNDFYKSADWAKASIAKCVKTGIVSGRVDKTLAPKDNISRAEVAVITKRLLEKCDLI